MSVGNGLLINLRVISSVGENERISSLDGSGVDVSRPGFWQSFSRWLRGEDRNDNLNTVELILNEAFDSIGSFLQRVESADIASPSDVNFIRRVAKGLSEARGGLESLKITYGSDLRTVARIDTFRESIDIHLDKLSEFVVEVQIAKINNKANT